MVRGVSWWILAGAVALPVLGVSLGASGRAYPVAAGRDLGPPVAALEAAASRSPGDRGALVRLASAYLDRGAVGLAEAALARAPEEVRAHPEVANLRGQALAALGNVPGALLVGRTALEACRERADACPSGVHAHAERRVAWLEELTRMGVEDAHADPERALLAYRLSSREVRLEAP